MLQGNMYNKKYYIGVLCLIFLMAISFVSAKPPVTTEYIGDNNLVIEANVFDYYPINQGASVFIHVFNKSSGIMLDNTTTDCDVELTSKNGSLVLGGVPIFEDHHWVMTRPSTVVTERGKYALIIHCNATNIDGYKTFFFEANGFGEGLDIAHSFKFNAGLFFLMMFFVIALVGLFKVEHYIGKFSLYWVCHIFFVIGTFCIWQFNFGYTISFLGLVGIAKVLFYVSTIAIFPMMILSVVWIFYIHLFNEHFQKLVDKGEDPERAFAMAGKKSGGWFNGK
jgi:hypothetical protein